MSTHELSLNLAKSTSRRLGKLTALTVALASSTVPVVQADYIKVNLLDIAPGGTFFHGAAGETTLASAQYALIVQAASGAAHSANLTSVFNHITTGYNLPAADWQGTGLTSHQARADALITGTLGIMMYDNTQLNYSNWLGATDLDTIPDGNFNQVLTRMSYLGDFTGDGILNTDDYGLLDFLVSISSITADITHDGFSNTDDYGLLDYTTSAGPAMYGDLGNAVAPAPAAGVGAIPEPTTAALLMLGIVGLAGHRRKKESN